jgi:zinc transport system substrate-binding protein
MKYKPLTSIVVSLSVLAMLLSGCSNLPRTRKSTEDQPKTYVAVGIVPLATFVQKVGGDQVSVMTMIPPGNSPANYQPSSQEMQALEEAALYFSLQMPTETANILPKLADYSSTMRIVDLQKAVADAYPLLAVSSSHDEQQDGNEAEEDVTDGSVGADTHEQAEGSVDPHVWLSPRRVAIMVQRIADELAGLDPDHADMFQSNAAAYISELKSLDQEISKQLAGLKQKSFLIYHGSYSYFADDYGLDMIAIEIAGKQATPAELQHVIQYAKDHSIKTVFYQQEFDDQQAETVAEEIGGRAEQVAPLSSDYIGSLRAMVAALVKAEQ